jgi:hypothetical protein
VPATAADYRWIAEPGFAAWIEGGYCLTFVRDVRAAALIDLLRGSRRGTVPDLAGLDERSFAAWQGPDAGRLLLAGVRDLPEGALMIEVNGYLGVTASVMEPVARLAEVVAHFQNVNALDQFTWWRDGVALLDFEAVTGVMLTEPSPEVRALVAACVPLARDPLEDVPWADIRPGVFALAERITGLRITPELLDGEMLLAEVPYPLR